MPRIPIPEGFGAGAVRPPADPREEVLALLRAEDAELRAVEANVRARRVVAEVRAEAMAGLAEASGLEAGPATLAAFDAAGRGRLEAAPQAERPTVQRALGAAREGVRLAAHVADAPARDAARLDDLDATVAANRKAVHRGPSQLEPLLAESAEAIAAAGLAPAAGAVRLAAAREDLAESAALSLLDRDPEAALAALDSGPVARHLPAEVLAGVRASAEVVWATRRAESARRDRIARQSLRRAVARHLAAVGHGEAGRESVALRRDVRTVLGEGAARAFDRDLNQAHALAAVAAELAHAHPDAMDPIIVAAPADVRPRLEADKARLLAERADDPAAAAVRAPEIAELFAAAAEDPRRLDEAISASLERQGELGIPEADWRAVPRAVAQPLVASVEAAPVADRGAALKDVLDGAGPHAGRLLLDLKDAGLTTRSLLLAVAGENPVLARALADTADADLGALTEGLNAGQAAEVSEHLSALAVAINPELLVEIEKLALVELRRGGDPAMAAERALGLVRTTLRQALVEALIEEGHAEGLRAGTFLRLRHGVLRGLAPDDSQSVQVALAPVLPILLLIGLPLLGSAAFLSNEENRNALERALQSLVPRPARRITIKEPSKPEPTEGFEPRDPRRFKEREELIPPEVEVFRGTVFPVPDPARPQILIFPDVSDQIEQATIVHAGHERPDTKAEIDEIWEWIRRLHPTWKKVAGGRDEYGADVSEEFIPGFTEEYKDPATGKPIDGRPGSLRPDLLIETDRGYLIVEHVDVDKNGYPTKKEAQRIWRLHKKTGLSVWAFSKRWQLEQNRQRAARKAARRARTGKP